MERNCLNCINYLNLKNCPRMNKELTEAENVELYENENNKPCNSYKPDRRKLAILCPYFDYNELTGRVTFVPKKLGDALKAQKTFLTHKQSEEIFYYKEGYYRPGGKVLIHSLCAEELQEQFRSYHAREVIDYIKATTYDDFQEPPPSLINFKNGILNIKTGKLHKHLLSHIFLNQIPHNWNTEATCPRWAQFFEEVTGDDTDKQLLISSMAYCLYRDSPFDKSVMLIGEGSNGKTVLLKGLQALLGKENVSNRNLHELNYDRFATADLVGKLANISGDLSNNKLTNTAIFKQLSGKDTITVQKKFLNSQRVSIYAKLIFATNQPPEPKYDVSLAFFRRWNLITFPKIFMGKDKDPFILKKLTNEEEMEGLAVLLVAYLKRLLQNEGFPENQTVEEIKQHYLRKANPVQSFAEDLIIEKEGNFILTSQLHRAYSQYCKQHHYSSEGKNKFKQAFEKLGYLYDRKNNRPGFSGIDLLEKKETQQLKDYFAENAEFSNVPFRKKRDEIDEINVKLPLMHNIEKNGKNGSNKINTHSTKICPNCEEPIEENQKKIIIRGEEHHSHCHAKIETCIIKCKNLTKKEDQPFCDWLHSFLVDSNHCNSEDCDGWTV